MANLDVTHATTELHPSESLRTYFVIFFWLMGLLVLTVVAAQFDLDQFMGGLNAIVALAIAVVKAALVVMFFMHVKHSSKLTWIFASATLLWLAMMMTFTFNDYATRETVAGPAKLEPDRTLQSPLEHTGGLYVTEHVSEKAH